MKPTPDICSQVACWLRGARHVRFRHSYDFAMSSYILRNRLRIIGGWMAQVWLVTGSSRGLGRAIVEAGLAAGNKVLATARDIKSLADLSKRYGDQVKLFAMDVTDEAAAANAVMAAVDVFGSLDVVINNAGYGNL